MYQLLIVYLFIGNLRFFMAFSIALYRYEIKLTINMNLIQKRYDVGGV